tara:strand:+ start:1249 stop:1434 length:186 start_codon:yes stop_codon:yes gene_type:complete
MQRDQVLLVAAVLAALLLTTLLVATLDHIVGQNWARKSIGGADTALHHHPTKAPPKSYDRR